MNFMISKINFDEEHPYTVELRGFLSQSTMLAYLKGSSLEVEYPKVLSEKQISFVKNELLEYFSDGLKNDCIDENQERCPIVIYIPSSIR